MFYHVAKSALLDTTAVEAAHSKLQATVVVVLLLMLVVVVVVPVLLLAVAFWCSLGFVLALACSLAWRCG